MARTFRVSDVERANVELSRITARAQVVKLGWSNVEALAIDAEHVVDGPLVHPLALAIDRAFNDHRPLTLTPDAVWLCLAQSLATHVDTNAEVLRPRLVRHRGQLALDVRRDDFVPGDPSNDWPAAIAALTARIREHLGGRADLFVADFSTTRPVDRVASHVALMGAMRQYFTYSVSSLCGIPEITLAGTVDDWTSIRRRAAVFAEFDLDWWLPALEPALAIFEATARGEIDVETWRRFYKLEHESGGDRAYGWFTALFAYVGDPPERNAFPGHDAESFTSSCFDGHKLGDLPPGRTRTSFTWKFPEHEVAMELIGGLWGATVDERGGMGVATGWLVAPAREDSGFVLANNFMLSPRTPLTTLAGLRHEATDEPRSLWLRAQPLASLDGIEHVRGLVALDVAQCAQLTSIAPLARLARLARLRVEDSPIENIDALAHMASLTNLDLTKCTRLGAIGHVLATLPQLEMLCLMNTSQLVLADFLPIANMKQLAYLVLWRCEALPEHLRRAHHGVDVVARVRAEIAALGAGG